MLKKLLHKNIVNGKKTLALLIDPDKHNDKSLVELLSLAGNRDVPHIILIGGSIVFNGIDKTVEIVKKYTSNTYLTYLLESHYMPHCIAF